MDKQINLYGHIQTEAARKRRRVGVAMFCVALIFVLGWGAWAQKQAATKLLAEQSAKLDENIQRESALISVLERELKARQASPAQAQLSAFSTDLRELAGRAEKRELATIAESIASWRGQGAALRHVSYDKNALALSGDARGALEAKNAVAELARELARAPGWSLTSQEVHSGHPGGAPMEFKILATRQGGRS